MQDFEAKLEELALEQQQQQQQQEQQGAQSQQQDAGKQQDHQESQSGADGGEPNWEVPFPLPFPVWGQPDEAGGRQCTWRALTSAAGGRCSPFVCRLRLAQQGMPCRGFLAAQPLRPPAAEGTGNFSPA